MSAKHTSSVPRLPSNLHESATDALVGKDTPNQRTSAGLAQLGERQTEVKLHHIVLYI
jgi:hypothetical protein